MTLHLPFGHAHQRSSEQQQDVREARRLLQERVRDDWDYPTLPQYQVPARKRKAEEQPESEETVAGFKFHNPSKHDRHELLHSGALNFEPVEWRERDYSSEESDGNESVGTSSSAGSKTSAYKFDGPDSVGSQLRDRKLARRRNRLRQLDEEVAWNEGLAHWMARRDVWSAAHTSQQVHLHERSKAESSDSTATSENSTPRSSTSSHNSHQSSPAASSPSTTPELEPQRATTNARPAASPSDLLIPLAPPILVNHPVRKRITPDIYPEIYAKIIIQGRTPSVPLNLLNLTRALVQGWKDDGEWPPKAGPVEKSIGRKKSHGESSIKSGVRAVGRVLRITSVSGESSKEKEKGGN